jgi:hypothetical protein
MLFGVLRGILLLAFCAAAFAGRWEVSYFHDEDKSSLTITDLKFPSATRGVATAVLQRERNRPKPVVLVTSDGGSTWSTVETRDPGISLFFLSETDGWMVTASGVWSTHEAGRSWTRILKRKDLTRVHFVTPERGWAIGAKKTLLQTSDGGKTWQDVPEAETLKTNPDWTVFSVIAFGSDKFGLIAGASRNPRRREEFPIWMDPEASRQRERPSLSIILQTIDGGATWKESRSSLFGRISEVDLARDGRGLALLEFEHFFDYPSEVFCNKTSSADFGRCFRRKDFAATDVAVVSGGTALIAGFQPVGLLAHTPVPGKVRIVSSRDLVSWNDCEVDYRAVAKRVMLAVIDEQHAWAATDTGMILRHRP